MADKHYLIEGILWIRKENDTSYTWGVYKQEFSSKIKDFDKIIKDLKKIKSTNKGFNGEGVYKLVNNSPVSLGVYENDSFLNMLLSEDGLVKHERIDLSLGTVLRLPFKLEEYFKSCSDNYKDKQTISEYIEEKNKEEVNKEKELRITVEEGLRIVENKPEPFFKHDKFLDCVPPSPEVIEDNPPPVNVYSPEQQKIIDKTLEGVNELLKKVKNGGRFVR